MATLSSQYEQLPPIARLGLSLLLMAVVAWYVWDDMVMPKQEILTAKNDELTKIVNELRDSNTLVSPVSMEEELNKANREYKKMIELLPDEPAIEKILNDFASLSRLSGVEIREFMPVTPPSAAAAQGAPITGVSAPTTDPALLQTVSVDEDTSSITISVKLQGTFSSMVSFMDMAMSIPRVIRIQDFEILHEDRELKLVQRPKLSFTGKFTAYFQRGTNTKRSVVAEVKNGKKNSNKDSVPATLIDINSAIDKSFSAKGSTEP